MEYQAGYNWQKIHCGYHAMRVLRLTLEREGVVVDSSGHHALGVGGGNGCIVYVLLVFYKPSSGVRFDKCGALVYDVEHAVLG